MSVLVCSANPEILIGEARSETQDLPWRLSLLVLLEEFSFQVERILPSELAFIPNTSEEKVNDLL